MINTHKITKEIRAILLAFSFLAVVALAILSFIFYQINAMHVISSNIYNHPLKVSNAALTIKSEILKIHKDIKDIAVFSSQEEHSFLIKDMNKHEKHIYQYLNVIEKNILGEDGKKLYINSKELLTDLKQIDDEIIALVNNNEFIGAANIVKTKHTEHVLKLEVSLSKIYEHAQQKAMKFQKESDKTYEKLEITKVLIITALLFVFIFVTYYIVQLISKYIDKNEHLKGVLSVIRNVNQLIVREKDKHALIQESCNILASEHVFVDAWIVLTDSDEKIEYIAGTDNKKDFTLFKEKIKSGWTPYCVAKTVENNNVYSIVEKTKENCLECPLMELHSGKSVFNIALKYDGKFFGYLTLSLDKNYIQYAHEIPLIEEVAEDIAYALNNLDIENDIGDLKELYDNTINSVENLIFVKDTKFTYIACNKAFEKFIGKSKDEIIGKNDYDIVDKEVADFFREHDKIMFADKVSKQNFEWVTYPDGKKVYLLTVKSPLLNSAGELLGLVGNSADLTELKLAQNELQISTDKFEKAFNKTPNLIIISNLETGKIYDINQTFEKIFGYAREELIGKTTHDIDLWISLDDRAEYIEIFKKDGYVEGKIYSFNKKNKEVIIAQVYANLITIDNEKYILAVANDITQQQNTLLQLEQKKKELETIIQEAPNPIMLHNEDGKVLLINKAWEKLTEYSYEDIDTIEKWTQKAFGEKGTIVKEYIDTLYSIDKKIIGDEYPILTKNGSTLIWQFSSAPMGLMDSKRTVISAAMDITELKKKDELMIVQSRHAAMGEMIGMIAHQWRQPLNIISMVANNILLDLAFEDFKPSDAEKYSRDILNQTEHLSKTIDDFRNFFKPDKNVSKVNLESILNETYVMIKDSLVNHNIEFKIFNKSEVEVNAYSRELMQVFVNIINNAKDALLLNKIKDASIEVSIYEDENYVNTKICDNGGGIKDGVISKIFDPYFTTKDEKTGTGLGLYMSKMIVEDHLHGSLEVFNTDKGVCFNVRLLKSKD